jgi:type II secretory pathway pseudopilin PulG
VIIGILAAVAIPKLFGMSAKAKAQEVGPAVGTWSKMQLAYNMETSSWGDAQQISYKVPGGKAAEAGEAKGTTSNFEYTVPKPTTGDNGTATWEAESAFSSDPCKIKSKWTAEIGKFGETAEMVIENASGSEESGCLSLTPSYYSIGCSDAKDNEKAPKCADIAPKGP